MNGKIIHGDDLLYRFLQDALRREPELFARVPQMLLTAMGIWLPLDVYRQWPILLPWVVRDPKCRGSARTGEPDRWSAPNSLGYLCDDNSMIKGLPRALPVRGPKGSPHLRDARMGTEFVASHVWRVVQHAELASRIAELNSFVPNLVWLPSQIAKLTDREAGTVQATLQAMAFSIYRTAPVEPHLKEVAEAAWALIPEPTTALEPIAPDDLNWFESTPAFFRTRGARLASVMQALEALERGDKLDHKVITTRYTEGLPSVSPARRAGLLERLRAFVPDT